MKRLKVTLELVLNSDDQDDEVLKEDVYNEIQELMEDDSLMDHISVTSEDDEEEES